MASISNSQSNTLIVGTSENDSIYNSAYYVTINSGAGKDTVYNGNGNYSYIDSGDGYDSISVYYNYRSTILGGAGNDTITGNYMSSELNGNDGNDYIHNYRYSGNKINGGKGNDTISLSGGSEDNVIQYAEGDGNDVIYGYTNDENTIQITEGSYSTLKSGKDIVIKVGEGKITLKNVENIPLEINGILDDGLITLSAGNSTYSNESYNFSIIGGAEANTIFNSARNAKIYSGAGNDFISNSGEKILWTAELATTPFTTRVITIKLTAATVTIRFILKTVLEQMSVAVQERTAFILTREVLQTLYTVAQAMIL